MIIEMNGKEYAKIKNEFDELIRKIIIHALKTKYYDWYMIKEKKETGKTINGKDYYWINPNWDNSRCEFPECNVEKEIVEWDFKKDKPILKKLCAYHNGKFHDGLITEFSDGFKWNYAQWKDGRATLPDKWVPATGLFVNFIKLSGNDHGNRRKIKCDDCGIELFSMRRDRFDKWGYGYHIKPFKRTSFFVDGKVLCYYCAMIAGWGGERVGSC
jgi:hypothetical protein